MTKPLRYRPHHFLCSLGFEGKGYSDAFTANMEAIVMDTKSSWNASQHCFAAPLLLFAFNA